MVDRTKDQYKLTSPEPISLKITEKIVEQMKNSICRIENNEKSTGFFVKVPYKSKILPVLITTNNAINIDDILSNKNISLYLNNDKTIKELKLDDNRLKYTNEKLDITIIEIKENEDKLNVQYLELDDELINYFKQKKKESPDYLNNSYLNESIYLLNKTKTKDIFVSYGKLLYINNSDITHNCNIKEEASFSPILLLCNQKLIGIHYGNTKKYKYNKGKLLIYSLIEFSKIKNNLLIINKEGKNISMNYIIGEFDIKKVGQDIRIINSYEKFIREYDYNEYKKEYENEKQIKENCMIINDEFFPFSYFHKFNKKGKYTILYIFKKNITNTNYMFTGCSSLTKIDLSNFKTIKVTDMSDMFSGCSSLTNINLSNFNTYNVTDMSGMFDGCSSLININLSNFNTNKVTNMSHMSYECSSLMNINLSNFNTYNVTDMSYMFYECSSLTNINLSNFNTIKVTDMSWMFDGCKSLKAIDLSNFKTIKVTDMSGMFCECSSLTNINLSNFNTNNVTDMRGMFSKCSSLTNINLSNFNTNNVTNMSSMFYKCSLLKIENIITKDKEILTEFKNK